MSVYTDLIYENYEQYINENSEEFSSPQGAIEMLTSDGAFKSYMTALTEGLTPAARETVMAAAEREREMLLEESAQIGPTAVAVGYAVSYFPILTDIYAEPLLSEVCTLHTTNTPIFSIPKVQIAGSVQNSDGSTSSFTLPRPTQLVRGATEYINLAPNTNNDLFALSAGGIVTSNTSRINRRYFVVDQLEITDDSTTPDTTTTVNLFIRPDARGQIHKEFEFTDGSGNTVEATLIGNINWDTGVVTYSVTFNGAPGVTYTAQYARSRVMFSPTTGDVGRVKVRIQMTNWDIDVDERESFEIELSAESIQEYRDIYNIDLIRTMAEAIKRQILHNKDWDISYFLGLAEPDMISVGSNQTVDLHQFLTGAGDYRPANVLDVFKGVIPFIDTVTRNVEKVWRAAPQYLVTNPRVATMLDALQDQVVNMPEIHRGERGFAAKQMSFRKQTIIPCFNIEEDKIYVVFRAPVNDKSRSALIDVVYKPVYIVEEITNSQKRTYVKSRTAIENVAPEAMGVVEVQNLADFVG